MRDEMCVCCSHMEASMFLLDSSARALVSVRIYPTVAANK